MVVSDSSPLIYLAALNDFHLLKEFFGSLVIPPAVYEEVVIQGSAYPVAQAVASAVWIGVEPLRRVGAVEFAPGIRLHAGETQAILLAKHLNADSLLMDDSDAVTTARLLGLNVIRTPGIYRLAKERGRIPSLRAKLDQLRAAGFRLKDTHYQKILGSAGEL
ncbi:MAG: DUF3368 domain-containing protein [Bryobacteraceae bacterium]